MDLKEFINSIVFSGLNPMEPGIILLTGSAKDPVPSLADLHMTVLPENNDKTKDLLKDICKIPRMSTFAIGAIINRIVSSLKNNAQFVNVGVWNGFTFFAGMASNETVPCVGIDNFSEFGGPRSAFLNRFKSVKSHHHFFYDMDYREYFAMRHSGPIGFYIYDGNHAREHQCKGLQVAEPFFTEDCIIFIDDINTPGPMEGTLDFIRQSKHKYEVLAEQRTAHNMHPTFWNGIALLKRIG